MTERAGQAPAAAKLTARGERTRAALKKAGRQVFEQSGFYEARIIDITRAAGCAVGSFYTYFESKEELFRALLIDLENEVYQEPHRLPQDAPPLDRIRQTNRLYFDSFRQNSVFWAVVEEAALQNAEARKLLADRHHYHRARTHRALLGWQRSGVIPADVNLAFAATALGAMTERCAYLWFVLKEPVDVDEAVENISKLWADALGLRTGPTGESDGRP